MGNNTLAYGFTSYAHLAAERVTTVGTEVIWNAIKESTDMHTGELNKALAGWIEKTTKHTERYMLPGSGTLQPMDENGVPIETRPNGYYNVSFPIQGGGTAWGKNRVSRAKMTVGEANRLTLDALQKDADWMIRHIMASVLDNTSWTFADPLYSNLTIQPLANGDTVTYNKIGGSTATDDHYLAQADSIDDTHNPFPTIADELTEHPGNGDTVVCFVPTNLKTSIQALTDFVERDKMFVNPSSLSDRLAGNAQSFVGPGKRVLGAVGDCLIVEWVRLPDNYMFAVAPDAGPFIYQREEPESELQGFFPEAYDVNGNLQGMRMLRYAGFGVVNRVAALVFYIGDASYSIPSAYTTPLAI